MSPSRSRDRSLAGRRTAGFKQLQLHDCCRHAMLCCSLHFSRRQSVSHRAVRAVTVMLVVRAPQMQIRCVLVLPDPASASPAEPPCSTTGKWVHDASAFAVTPETKSHRPTDLHACVEEEPWRRGWVWWIARPTVSTASFPRAERCAQYGGPVWREGFPFV
jgi:hypothetical protein